MERSSSVRVVLEATLDRSSVIRGTLTDPGGRAREFHGWLELTTAIEAAISSGRIDPEGREAGA